jgi:hypothetical protein
MEADGSRPNQVSSALHFSDVWPYNTHISSGLNDPSVCGSDNSGTDYSDGFHDFVLYWDRNKMTMVVDGRVSWEVNMNRDWYVPVDGSTDRYTSKRQPWDRAFYFVFNVAVGGWFLTDPVPSDAAAWSSPQMIIDYVKVEQRFGDATGMCANGDDDMALVEKRDVCRVKSGVSDGDLAGALGWVCTQQDCGTLYANAGVAGGTNTEKANVAFNAYWENSGKTGTACCFGDSDGVSNCKAEVTCALE